MHPMRWASLTLCLAAAGLLASCRRAPDPAPNLLLLTIDTLRADRTSAYGYGRPTTPELEGLARSSALFERAYSQAPFTAPSHASLFTGLVSQSHGLLHWSSQLDGQAITFAEHFAGQGYRTGAFYNHASLPVTGLLRGFEHESKLAFDTYERTLEALWAWTDTDRKGLPGEQPFAVWLHFWDVHRPYGFRDWKPFEAHTARRGSDLQLSFAERGFGPEHDARVGRLEEHYNVNASRRERPLPLPGEGARVFGPADWRAISDRYDNGVRYADQGLGALLRGLEQRGLLERTVLCVTSDHGETLTERPGCWFTHDPYLYEETLRVPLLFRFPKKRFAGVRSRVLARGIDVLPTLVDAAGVEALEVQGRSLLAVLEGSDASELPLFAQTQTRAAKESDLRLPKDQQGRWLEHRQAIFDGRFKLIRQLEPERIELYDLERDPGELRDLSADPAGAAELKRLLGRLLDLERSLPSRGSGRRQQSEEELRVLFALGYISEDELEQQLEALRQSPDPGAGEAPR